MSNIETELRTFSNFKGGHIEAFCIKNNRKENMFHGTLKTFDAFNELENETEYFKNQKHGVEKIYRRGKLLYCSHFIHNKRHGLEYEFSLHDGSYYKRIYSFGLKSGLERHFTKEHELKNEINWVNGINANNPIEIFNDFSNDNIEYTQIYDNGFLIEEIPYCIHQIHGLYKKYHHGVIHQSIEFKKGIWDGFWTYFNYLGNCYEKNFYQNGFKTSHKQFDEDGNLVTHKEFSKIK